MRDHDISAGTAWTLAALCGVGLVVLGVTQATGTDSPAPKPAPGLIAEGPAVYRIPNTPPVTIPQAEARRRVEATGHTWAEFLTQTTDRPRYDVEFIRAWLNQPAP